jgi:DNA polymerase-3 subunit delta
MAEPIRVDDLGAHLARKLAPLYVVHGDEPLLALEAGDTIRAAARKAGATEREVLVVEQGFRWDAFVAAHANMGLFGERKLIDLRIPSGKPGTEGAKALEQYAANPNADNVTLITLPRVDRATQSSPWFAALADAGVTIAVYPIERDALPRWISARLAAQGQQASRDTLVFLAERCEGNLLAARQEIEKLALLLPRGALDASAVEQVVANVARYDVFQLSEAWLAGDAARTVRILGTLQAEGEAVTLAIWQLGEDLHALAGVQQAVRAGTPIGAAVRNARAWGKRQNALERAARRVKEDTVTPLLAALARLDALAKGLTRGNAWESLERVALALCGAVAPPDPRTL